MGRPIAKLPDARLRSIKPTDKIQKLSDGRGLQFWVTPTGGKYWRMDYRFLGKKKLLTIGPYPEISAAKAREIALKAREHLALGRDPGELRRQERLAAKAASEHSFASLAKKLVEKKRKEQRAQVTLDKMEWIFNKIEEDLGSRDIKDIRTPDIVAALKQEEEAGNLETARRMRTVIGEVFRYAMQNGIISSDPVQATRGAIARPQPKHHSAILEPERFGQVLRLVDEYAARNVVTGNALQLMALLFPRPGELRQANWDEFDFEKAVWTIPSNRMKMRRPHAKPLPRQAVAILKSLREITGPTGFVFPATGRPGRPMSENTLNVALRRMGIEQSEHTSHGYRATASTFLNDSNLFSVDAIERELAHQDEDAVRRAYRRGEAMTERVKMIQWWADHLDTLRAKELRVLTSINADIDSSSQSEENSIKSI